MNIAQSAPAKHRFAVAVKAAILNDDRLLVLNKSADERSRGVEPTVQYDFPGGRMEFGEQPVEALKREVYEETGLDIEVGQLIDAWTIVDRDFGLQLVGLTYLCRKRTGEVQLSDEHVAASWLSRMEIQEQRIDPDGRFVRVFDL